MPNKYKICTYLKFLAEVLAKNKSLSLFTQETK